MVSSTFSDFNKAYEGEIWCLCTVTFGQKVQKLNSRPVYCLQIYVNQNWKEGVSWRFVVQIYKNALDNIFYNSFVGNTL